MKSSKAMRIALATHVAAGIFSYPAAAQTSPDAAQTAAGVPEAVADEGEIVVTAQKRAENIQDVPLAVTVVTGQQLETANVREFTELYKIAPSLAIRPSDSAQNAAISIRGIGTFAFSPGVESAVAIQIDDVPLAFQARAFSDLVDIERIEVLRGPQSTLYGKNASAGLINIVTRAPGTSFRGRAGVTATTDDEYRVDLSASGPVTETLRAGFGASYRTFDGNVRNLTTGDTVNGSDNVTVRGRLVWDATPDLLFDLNVNYADLRSTPTFSYRALAPDAALRGNVTQTPAVVMPGIVPGFDNLRVTNDDQPFFRSTSFGRSLRGAWTLPNEMTLVSITAFDDYRSGDRIDSDRTQSTLLRNRADGTLDGEAFSQEIRLLSPSTGRLRYTLGLFHADSEQRRTYRRGPAFSLADWNATAGSAQWAAFGQADWEFLPRTTLTLGLRGQRETIDYTFNDLRAGPTARFAGDSSDDVVTYRVGLKHDFSDDVMVFASHSRGHKGQAYDLTTGFNAVRASLGPVRAERSDAYEAGFRAQLIDRRLTVNGTIFQTDYNDLQTQAIEEIQGVPTFRLTNVGQSRTRGVEADVALRPIRGLNLYASGTYLDARYIDFRTAPCNPGQTVQQGCTGTPPRQDLSGQRFSVPMWRANAGWDLAVPVGAVEALFDGSYAWQSEVPNADPLIAVDTFGIFNLGAGIRSRDRGWTLRLFVNNLFDKQYSLAVGNQSGNFGGRTAVDFLAPRDFRRYGGIRLSTDF